jgi:excisionase family DNA binding protein
VAFDCSLLAVLWDYCFRDINIEGEMSALDVLTSEQAAEALGCKPQHLDALAAQHAVPAVKYGRSWRYPVAAFNQYLVKQALEHIETPAPAPAATPLAKLPKRKRALPDLSKYSAP